MNRSHEFSVATELSVDSEAAAHCLLLLSSLDDISEVHLWPADAGVWNNIVINAVTPQQTYYFKQYRELLDIPNYSPPQVSPEQRAQVAQIAQTAATESLIDDYRLVPAVLARDATSFVMEAVPAADSLLGYLSSGRCPDAVTSVLPVALARFHSAARSEYYVDTPLSDNRFRDYKIGLQYLNVAQFLNPKKRKILRDFADYYRRQQECIAHGDLNSKNVLITSGGTAHVIDFEQAHLGTPAFDLAYFLSELYIAEIQHKLNPVFHNLCSTFLERYFEVLQGYDNAKVSREATLHLAAQVRYRLTGPSHKVWTSYVSNGAQEEALSRATSLIVADPRPLTSVLKT